MVISGVHLSADGKPVRYKVENSWGEGVGKDGYFIMTDAWFEQYAPLPLPLDSADVFLGSCTRSSFPRLWLPRTWLKFMNLMNSLSSLHGTPW